MFRVMEEFRVWGGVKPVVVDGLSIGKPRRGDSLFCIVRDCIYVKDYDTRENYEKNFTVLNDGLVEVLHRLGFDDSKLQGFEKRVHVYLLDECMEEPMTFRKWREIRKQITAGNKFS